MYPISNEAKALFEAEHRQVLRITGTDASGATIDITDANVTMGSFSIDRSSCIGSKIEIGSAIASELMLTLDNSEGAFDGIIFEGTELFVEIGIADWEQENPTVYWIPCGYFTCDEQPRNRTTIALYALDRMVKFDVAPPTVKDVDGNIMYSVDGITFPCALSDFVSQVCAYCGIALGGDITTLPNADYIIVGMPQFQTGLTFRTIIQWCAEIMATCAYIDWNGELRFSWYSENSGYISTPDTRYFSDLYENDISITGVIYTDLENTLHVAGTTDYALNITGNALMGTDATTISGVLQAVYVAVNALTYRPFEASVMSAPWLFPLDKIVFEDASGNTHITIITSANTTLNGKTELMGSGETYEINGYDHYERFTPAQMREFQRLRFATSDAINKAVSNATSQITGAANSHVRFMYDANGGLQEILIMDTEDITTAVNVWRWNSGGLGFSPNGYAGPYTTAITQDGNIVANFVTLGTLSGNLVRAGTIIGQNGSSYWNLDTGELYIAISKPGEDTVYLNTQLWVDSEGLHISTADSSGEVLITSSTVDIRVGGQTFSQFSGNYVQFGNYQLRRSADGGLVFKLA